MLMILYYLRQIQAILNKIMILKSRLDDLNFVLNTAKSKCMVFKRYGHCLLNSLMLGSDEIEMVNDFKYLGHYIGDTLTDMKNVEYHLHKFYGKFHSMIKNLKDLSTNTLFFLFNYFCSPECELALRNHKGTYTRQDFKTFELPIGRS